MSTPESGNPFLRLFQSDDQPRKEPSALLNLFLGEKAPNDSAAEVEPPPNCAVAFAPEHVFWSLRDIPVTEAVKSFMICGAPGSGKTKGIQLFLQSIAPRIIPTEGAPPEQLIMFDAKGDAIPMLASMDLRPELGDYYILNPFDTRCAIWHLGEAITEPGMDAALAALLVPEDKTSTAPYFTQAAQEVVKGVIQSLQYVAGTEWTLRDVLCAVESVEHIKRLTSRFGPAKRKVHAYINDEKHFSGVLSTIASKIGRFDAVAALWAKNRGGPKFSAKEFLRKPGVLILGNDPVLRDSIWPFNAIILKSLTNQILRQSDTFSPRHWFILDEFRAMEKVDCIHSLLNMGRSKGASVTLGIQTVEGINQIYGEDGASDIMAMCAYKTFLRAGSYKTAEWAERHFSKVRQMETSYSSGASGNSTNRALHERSLFLASTFLDLGFPGPGADYESISDVPCIRETIFSRRPFEEILAWARELGDVPALDAVTEPDAHLLHPWDEVEEAFFLTGPKQVAPPINPSQAQENGAADAQPPKEPDPPGITDNPPGTGPSLDDFPGIDSIRKPTS